MLCQIGVCLFSYKVHIRVLYTRAKNKYMADLNYLALFTAVIVAFVASMIWYIIFAKQRARLSHSSTDMKRPQPLKMVIEIFRNIILASVIAFLVHQFGISSLTRAINLGIVLWIGFPLMLLTGSIMWENVSWKLALIHSGDWFIKLLVMTIILGVWH